MAPTTSPTVILSSSSREELLHLELNALHPTNRASRAHLDLKLPRPAAAAWSDASRRSWGQRQLLGERRDLRGPDGPRLAEASILVHATQGPFWPQGLSSIGTRQSQSGASHQGQTMAGIIRWTNSPRGDGPDIPRRKAPNKKSFIIVHNDPIHSQIL